MIILNKKIVTTILILFFLTSVLCLISNNESKGVEYGAISYILFFNHSKITKYDYIFVGSLLLGTILNFITIFYKNIYLTNIYALIISGLAVFAYLKNSNKK
ncbi:hypothetical protein CCS79_18235 [Clostridium diolis]|uniref:hypothetical protein n=1 Tax=Clostridium diolis TaxID=223919 RepID=UPI000B3F8732|nr:hypothetical protein [Clostridium diolis]OVE66613.1 hypothetical protein CCS79_18235 [Clostridium diolis]